MLSRRTPTVRSRGVSNDKPGGNRDQNPPTSDQLYLLKQRSQQRWLATRDFIQNNLNYVLLGFVPLGILAGMSHWNPISIFVLNMLAITPLAALLSFVTEELSANVGQTVGALLNATFGNAPELIVSTVALTRGEIRIVQASMLGAVLSNMLLALGGSLFAGGYRRDCRFNATAASTMSSLMAVASASLIIPTALHMAFSNNATEEAFNSILILSRGTSVILLILYTMYLYFQLKTHSHLFEQSNSSSEQDSATVLKDAKRITLSPLSAILVLFMITVAIAICAEFLVGTIDDIVLALNINKTFIGLIVLPIVGNIAEHITAITAASKDKMDLAIGVAIGSSMQIALLVTPALVILGWIIDSPMSLYFAPFDTVVFFLSVLIVIPLIQDGESNYLEGAMLVGTYCIIAISFYVYPDNVPAVPLASAVPNV